MTDQPTSTEIENKEKADAAVESAETEAKTQEDDSPSGCCGQCS